MEDGPETVSLAAPPVEAPVVAPAPAPPPFPVYFTTLDPALESLILSKLPPRQGAQAGHGAKKRRREEMRGTQSCHSWASTGTCSYGDACRYSHSDVVAPVVEQRGKDQMRALAIEREKLFIQGGVAAGGVEGAESVGTGEATAAAASTSASASAGSAASASAPAGAYAKVPDLATLSSLGNAQERMVGPQVTPLSQVARYYTRMFSPGMGRGGAAPGWDIYVHLQANRVCVVGVASAHPLLHHAATVSPILSIAYQPTFAAIATSLSGKRKKGSLWVEADTVIAHATTADGLVWPLRAGMRGSLVEVNHRLATHPTLLTKKPATQGHLAVIMTHFKRVLEVTQDLLSEAHYAQLCAARGLPGP
jgi:hypothetical protein